MYDLGTEDFRYYNASRKSNGAIGAFTVMICRDIFIIF
jgi:hypothetical protein